MVSGNPEVNECALCPALALLLCSLELFGFVASTLCFIQFQVLKLSSFNVEEIGAEVTPTFP